MFSTVVHGLYGLETCVITRRSWIFKITYIIFRKKNQNLVQRFYGKTKQIKLLKVQVKKAAWRRKAVEDGKKIEMLLSIGLTWRWLLTCEIVSPFTSIILRTSFGVASVSFKPKKYKHLDLEDDDWYELFLKTFKTCFL